MSNFTKFVSTLERLPDIGLVICKNEEHLNQLESQLQQQNYRAVLNWKDLLETPGKVSLVVTSNTYTAELDELLAQNARGKAHIQVMERSTLDLIQRTIDYSSKAMLLLIAESALKEISATYDLLGTMGPIFREESHD